MDMKTLIVAQGLERERILAAISLHSPNKLVILRSKKDVTKELEKFIDKHIETLKKLLFPPKERMKFFPFLLEIDDTTRVDFFDLTSAIAEINAKIKDELSRGNEVSVDISSGNKIIIIALFIVAQMYGLKVTYCSAGKYASMREESIEEVEPDQIAFSVRERYEVPRIPLKLERIPVEVLVKLKEMGGKVDSIKTLAEKLNPGMKIGKSEIIETSRKLEALEAYGYVVKRRRDRSVVVEITDSGKGVLALDLIFKENI